MALPSSHDTGIIQTLVILLSTAGSMAYLLHRLKLPPLLGFILSGAIIGPYGLKFIPSTAMIADFAHIGVLFLLFMVGLELSMEKLKALQSQVLIGGVLQLALCTLLAWGFFGLLGVPLQLAFLFGSIISLSSTSIVLKLLDDMAETEHPHGRTILGVLVIQDLAIIPLMTILPSFQQPITMDVLTGVGFVLIKAAVFLALSVLASFKIIPWLLKGLANANQRELFILAVVLIGLGTAWLTNKMGLSYEAGAFIAGLSLSGNLVSAQMAADSRPVRDLFMALFFVSLGSLADIDYAMAHAGPVLLVTLGLSLLKVVGTALALMLVKCPLRSITWGSLALFQVGEFSFVILQKMVAGTAPGHPWFGLLQDWIPLLIHASIFSMFVTPLILQATPKLVCRYFISQADNSPSPESTSPGPESGPDVLIAGYGPIAQMLTDVLQQQQVSFTVIDTNIKTITRLQEEGISSLFGDVAQQDILDEAGIKNARLFTITFPDIRASELAIQMAKQLNPNVFCIARSRFRNYINRLYDLGADLVIYDELETGITLTRSTLEALGYPSADVLPTLQSVHDREANRLQMDLLTRQNLYGQFNLFEGLRLQWVELDKESSLIGKTLQEANLRQTFGINVLSIVDANNGECMVSPEADRPFQPGDVLVVVGTQEQMEQMQALC